MKKSSSRGLHSESKVSMYISQAQFQTCSGTMRTHIKVIPHDICYLTENHSAQEVNSVNTIQHPRCSKPV